MVKDALVNDELIQAIIKYVSYIL